MIMIVAAVIGAMGLVSIITRKTVLGVLIGTQLLLLGATLMFVLGAVSSGVRTEGHIFGLFIALGGVGQLVAGYSLAVRLFYLKNKNEMDDLRSLKQ